MTYTVYNLGYGWYARTRRITDVAAYVEVACIYHPVWNRSTTRVVDFLSTVPVVVARNVRFK